MKKIYKSPTMQVVKLETVGMIAGSKDESLGGAGNYDGGGTLSGSREYDEW